MKIHEYQAKHILKKYDIPIPEGFTTDDPKESVNIFQKLKKNTGGVSTVVIKAQIHAGGRGQGGGVKLSHSEEETLKISSEILGMQLITAQTGQAGKKVLKILIEEGMDIEKEYYVGITLDRSESRPVFMVSKEGGMDIEEVASKTPEKIIKEIIDPNLGLQNWQASHLTYSLGLVDESAKQAHKLFMNLWRVYDSEDCSLIEINPMVQANGNKILALDCKINFDDNAAYRHPEREELRDTSEEEPLELEASKYNLNYVRLPGEVGCMVNGAGLAMATMDIIKHVGSSPANFLDVGGNANVETVTNGFKIILRDPNVKAVFVNIFGGIVRCDRIANGIIEAAKNVEIRVPLVVRLAGTNSQEAKSILEESGLKMQVASSLEEGAEKVVEAIQKNGNPTN